jgi:hypothetical protein
LETVRALYFLSVEDKHWAERLADTLDSALSLHPEASSGRPTLEAYRGALEVVRAKHARWPPNKLEHLKRGSAILDSLAAAHPDDPEVRYLRFASYRFLPFFLSRDETVSTDAQALVSGLQVRPPDLSAAMHRVMVEFVLAYAPLNHEDRARLARALPG